MCMGHRYPSALLRSTTAVAGQLFVELQLVNSAGLRTAARIPFVFHATDLSNSTTAGEVSPNSTAPNVGFSPTASPARRVTFSGYLAFNRWFGAGNVYVTVNGYAIPVTQLLPVQAALANLESVAQFYAPLCAMGNISADECAAAFDQLQHNASAIMGDDSSVYCQRWRNAFLGVGRFFYPQQPATNWDINVPYSFSVRVDSSALRGNGARLASLRLQCYRDDGYYYSGATWFLSHILVEYESGWSAKTFTQRV